MTHRLLACLIALTFLLSSTGPTLAAQPSQMPTAGPAAAVPTQTAVSQALLANPDLSIGRGVRVAAGAPNAEIAAVLATATQIAVGINHTCALTRTGGVKCWGRNDAGQLGDSTNVDHLAPHAVTGLAAGVTSIAAGGWHTCAVTAGGGVKCWGNNSAGELGDGTTTDRNVPVAVNGLSATVTAVAAGWAHTCAITAAGGVKCWGANLWSELGNSSSAIIATTPVAVSGLATGVTAISARGNHTCALTTIGSVKCWGRNSDGELGDGTRFTPPTPVAVSGLSAGVTAIAAGVDHSCAVTATGVKCWGSNSHGQLSNGTPWGSYVPSDVSGLDVGVTGLAAGVCSTCAITVSGGVKCWGWNSDGALGTGTTGDWYPPSDVSGLDAGVTAIAAGGGHTCALTAGGGVKCWGSNGYGQLGNSTMKIRTTPVAVSGLDAGETAIAVGGGHTCALTAGGGVVCLGANYFGQLGDGTTFGRYTPSAVNGLAAGTTALAAGEKHTCALTAGGGVKCWGSNFFGQLGNGTTEDRTSPVQVSGLTSGLTAIAAGDEHTCALTAGGGVKCWGGGSGGQLGDGTRENRTIPVAVSGLAAGVTSIAAGGSHTCALTAGGGVKCWGLNFAGQLGDGTTTNRVTPANVSGLAAGVTSIAAGGWHTCALTSAGGVVCWGGNLDGQLGDGTTTNRMTPANVSGLTSGVTAIAAGMTHACALTSAGGVVCWGGNLDGQLGDGTTTDRSIPVAVSGLTTGMTAITARYSHTCALTAGGGVQCWGSNGVGQLGVNPGWSPVDVVGFGHEEPQVYLPLIQR